MTRVPFPVAEYFGFSLSAVASSLGITFCPPCSFFATNLVTRLGGEDASPSSSSPPAVPPTPGNALAVLLFPSFLFLFSTSLFFPSLPGVLPREKASWGVSISACHADYPASIPGRGVFRTGMHLYGHSTCHKNAPPAGIEPATLRLTAARSNH